MRTFKKYNPGRSGEWEVAGLNWLAQAMISGSGTGAEATGGARVAKVIAHTKDTIELEYISESTPTKAAAEDFGRRLRATHLAGAKAFGAGPDNPAWHGDGYQGPNSNLLPLPLGHWENWGEFYADAIIDPLVLRCGAGLASEDKREIQQLTARLRAGEFDDGEAPARLHGDLWSGNVLWTAREAVLIDPAAHGGHPATDLAALVLFGTPHLEHILGAYEESAGWDGSWRELLGLHQLHLLLMHVAVFGETYRSSAMAAVRSALRS